MRQDLVNKIIEWKCSNPEHVHNYQRFLYEIFPENIKAESREKKLARRQSSFSNKDVTWIDHRVDNNEWREMFSEVDASDIIQPLGIPPGLDMDNANNSIIDTGTVPMDAQTISAIHQLSIWEKAKLAWQLGVAEVGNGLNVNVPALNALNVSTLKLRVPAINSDSSDTDDMSDGMSDGSDGNDDSESERDGEDKLYITEEQLSHIVVAFYEKTNPEKLQNVERIVKKYLGREEVLYAEWKAKYQVSVKEDLWFHEIINGDREVPYIAL